MIRKKLKVNLNGEESNLKMEKELKMKKDETNDALLMQTKQK
jgi:Leucine-rich repeat (LRR) protein